MNFFGINGGELIVLVVLALLLLGPEKIPEYTRLLRDWVRKIRTMAEGAKTQFKEETGTDFNDVDWAKYDPRQYDPRKIIREALVEPLDDLQTSAKNTGTTPKKRTGSSAASATTTAAVADTVAGGAGQRTALSPTTPTTGGFPPGNHDSRGGPDRPFQEAAGVSGEVQNSVPATTPFDQDAT